MDTYSLAFSLSNLGPKSFQKLLRHFGDAKSAWEGSREDYGKIGIRLKTFGVLEKFRESFSIEDYVLGMEKSGVFYISFSDSNYPEKLRKLDSPPIGIFCKGSSDLLSEELTIAVVGTRKVTNYGRSVTESIVEALVSSGVCIVSGLALGVDGIAHRTAVSNKGSTIAVLGCGVDCCLPSENYGLYSDILKNNGLILSEYPLSCPPNKGTFLARNRIVAALSDGVLITEAAEDSGSLVTAEWGFALQKKVFAVPGPITSRMSEGSLKLLKKGAALVSCGEDVFREFGAHKVKGKSVNIKLESLSKEEKVIVFILENEPLGIDELSRVSSMSIIVLHRLISSLEIKGVLRSRGGKIELIT